MAARMPHSLLPEDLGIACAILPGDPARVDRIAAHLTNPEPLEFNREYKSMAGEWNGVRILAMSTGMGGPSMAIGLEELHQIGVHYAIRIGSAGALQPDLRNGDLVIATSAVRQEGTTKGYAPVEYPAAADYECLTACIESARTREFAHQVGIVRSHDCLFGEENDNVYDVWTPRKVLASDMETAALFVIGTMRGMQTASILNIVSGFQGNVAENVAQYSTAENNAAVDGETREILVALDALAACYKAAHA